MSLSSTFPLVRLRRPLVYSSTLCQCCDQHLTPSSDFYAVFLRSSSRLLSSSSSLFPSWTTGTVLANERTQIRSDPVPGLSVDTLGTFRVEIAITRSESDLDRSGWDVCNTRPGFSFSRSSGGRVRGHPM